MTRSVQLAITILRCDVAIKKNGERIRKLVRMHRRASGEREEPRSATLAQLRASREVLLAHRNALAGLMRTIDRCETLKGEIAGRGA